MTDTIIIQMILSISMFCQNYGYVNRPLHVTAIDIKQCIKTIWVCKGKVEPLAQAVELHNCVQDFIERN